MTANVDPNLHNRLKGILPPVTMPFDESGDLIGSAIAPQIDFIIEKGAHGVVAGGSTGEGHALTDAEFLVAMEETYKAINGRVPFVAGLIVNSTRAAIARTKMMDGMKVDALQVTPVHYLFKPDAQATIDHFKAIYEETGIPILIYNVIPWNYLSADLMLRIMEEVPGVVGMKQSSGDLKSLSDLLLRIKPGNIVLSGIDALLYSGFSLGAHGAISALTSALPGKTVELWNLVNAGRHEEARQIHFQLNALWNTLRHDNLPACVKYIQHRQGLPLFHPRAPMEKATAEQKRAIDKALEPLLG